MDCKILFVDNESNTLDSYKRKFNKLYQVETALGGEQGLAAVVNRGPYAVIVSDIQMPGMDGFKFLSLVREIAPHSVQMILTGLTDRETTLKTLKKGNVFRFLAKPCSSNMLKKALDEGVERFKENIQGDFHDVLAKPKDPKTAKGLVEDTIIRIRRGEESLPGLPSLGMKQKKIIHRKFRRMIYKNAPVRKVSTLLTQDVEIRAEIIRAANSAYYKGVERITSLETAINRVGIETVKQYVKPPLKRLRYYESEQYQKIIEKIWDHSLACAHASQIVSNHLKLKNRHIFTAGMLHDVGKLALLKIIERMDVRGRLDLKMNFDELQNAVDAYHASFGGFLLAKWRYPRICALIARNHNHMEEGDLDALPREFLVVYFSNLLVNTFGFGTDSQGEIDIDNDISTRALKLNYIAIKDLKEKILEKINYYMDDTA